MRIKFIKYDDFCNYKKCSLFIGAIGCTWKCCLEQHLPCSMCQNNAWSKESIREYSNIELINKFNSSSLQEAIVFGGLEPLDQFDELLDFIDAFRKVSNADIVIYTGYYKTEIIDMISKLKNYKNIIIKYGRYIPNEPSRYDEVLGVSLASMDQYAEKIS